MVDETTNTPDYYIDFNVEKQVLTRADKNVIAEYEVNFLKARFTFDTIWDGLEKYARFTRYGVNYDVWLDENGTCIVPTECMIEGYFELAVFAENEVGRLTTTVARCYVAKSTDFLADPPLDPTDPLVWRFQQAVQHAIDIAQSVRDDADAGEFDGEKGDKGDPGESGTTVISITNEEIDYMWVNASDPGDLPSGDYVPMTDGEIDTMFE